MAILKRIKNILFLTLFVFLTTACQQAVKSFVEGGSKRTDTEGNAVLPSTTSSSTHVIKLSPGSQYSKGSAVEGQFTISDRQLTITGTQVKAKLGINITRTN